MKIILNILYELGYKNVFTILDNDKRDTMQDLQKDFPNYGFYAIATDDVRNKEDAKINKIIVEIKNMKIEKDIENRIVHLLEKRAHNVEGLIKNNTIEAERVKAEKNKMNLFLKIIRLRLTFTI